jgi:D-alanyl-D-alanine carboxypeptidase/D-alanyl-D-alanine endopeptidase (penicillin-binding protein 7)
MLKNAFIALLLAFCSVAWSAVPLRSAHVLVLDAATGQVLLEKDAATPAPIASMTKLMTAMVVLDARLPPDEVIRIGKDDYDTLKFTKSGVPAGSIITREDALTLALMSSDNHAAAALARTFPGGRTAFQDAVKLKIAALKLQNTRIEEPTGLSPNNHATAHDMAKILKAASAYPEIAVATSQRGDTIAVNGRRRNFRNTNGLVGAPGWEITASKTGFTNEAGRCVSMRLESAGRSILVVLMGAVDTSKRTLDALDIHRWLGGAQATTVASNGRATEARARPAARRSGGNSNGGRKPVRRTVVSASY